LVSFGLARVWEGHRPVYSSRSLNRAHAGTRPLDLVVAERAAGGPRMFGRGNQTCELGTRDSGVSKTGHSSKGHTRPRVEQTALLSGPKGRRGVTAWRGTKTAGVGDAETRGGRVSAIWKGTTPQGSSAAGVFGADGGGVVTGLRRHDRPGLGFSENRPEEPSAGGSHSRLPAPVGPWAFPRNGPGGLCGHELSGMGQAMGTSGTVTHGNSPS